MTTIIGKLGHFQSWPKNRREPDDLTLVFSMAFPIQRNPEGGSNSLGSAERTATQKAAELDIATHPPYYS